MTVRDHMKAAGYDTENAWNYGQFWGNEGMMECEKAYIKVSKCRPAYGREMIRVEAVAVVPFTDGYDHPLYFGGGIESRITAYFKLTEK